ncbi:hypothetical protein B0H34DRAFT_703302 [Crassisporium funariophilum]|nr:hypothetical protein B0H34DRAFT_703302 [Crassisporium funariophilum]
MNWSTSILTTISTDTEPSIVITFDNAKYIFNVPENSNRGFLQSNRNWRRARTLFFTQANVQRTSGLGGLLMTLGDSATVDKLNMYGPPGFTHLLASMRSYMFRDSLKITSTDIPHTTPTINPTPVYVDQNITVYAIPVLPSPEHEAPVRGIEASPSTSAQGKRKRSPTPDLPRKRRAEETDSQGKLVLSDLLTKALRNHNFNPGTLVGAVADEYRQLMIQTMFPYTNPTEESKPARAPPAPRKPKKEKQGREGREGQQKVIFEPVFGKNLKAISPESQRDFIRPSVPVATVVEPSVPSEPAMTDNVDDYRRSRAQLPRGFHVQLPKFSSNFSPSQTPPTHAYVIVGPRFRGKFDAAKAAALGVFGRDRSTLAKGKAVTVQVQENGETISREVQPDEVLGESEHPGVVIVLDTPSISHIPSLVSSFKGSGFYAKFWSEDTASLGHEYIVRAVYHICGDGVLENEGYKTFMNGFSPDVHHIIASREHCADPITFTSDTFNQLRLNHLDSNMFPLPKFSLVPKKDLSTISGLPARSLAMASSLHISLRPYAPPIASPEVVVRDKFHPIITGEKPLDISRELQSRIRNAQLQVAEKKAARIGADSCPGADVGILPLGTAASLPTKYRNVLSTLIRIPSWGSILLDTGEGTWGQMARHFGLDKDMPNNVWDVLRDLKCIFVSHMHGDHHMGLAKILAQRRLLDPPPNDPLYIVSVRGTHLYLREQSDIQDLGLHDPSGNGVISIISEALHHRSEGSYHNSGRWAIGGNEEWVDYGTSLENARHMRQLLGLQSFKTVDMFHRCRCYGVVLEHQDGWSVAFSGDTLPTENLVYAGKGVTVLIHEATMGDDEADMAKRKSHSTVGQAIDIGKRMKAKNILLTHFSARYPKMPPSVTQQANEGKSQNDPIIVPAFDHLDLTIGDMWKMGHYLPALELNFHDTMDEDDEPVPMTSVE